MKTTIEIPDDLARQAKELATAQRTTLRELVVEGLRAEIAHRSAPSRQRRFSLTTVGGQGLAADVDPSRMIDRSYGLPA